MASINKILVANRGEIARRVMRTCRRMGIRAVSVFSDADADAAFVRDADEAVRIGAPPPTESYLCIDKILAAAELTGADAIHPGYGFLAENPALARACADRGVTFIGPSPEVIRALGSKREAKRIMARAGIPVIPGNDGAEQNPAALAALARKMGFPVLLKASAGGGGKGMRIVRAEADLREAIESAKRESQSAFGDDTLLLETFIENPRHVEFQILGDEHGQVIHLFERECSIQRRHQKIIEETPSPALDPQLRQRMGETAVAVAKAVGYTNAGTVEFVLAPDGTYYFLEVNTRLQVEHPVTELTTGIDLVREQIRIAQGEHLSLAQAELTQRGSAIECRLYAEDPANGFLPTSGRIVHWQPPEAEGLRIDTGVDGPTDVSIYYDPLLAKIICHGPTRGEAIAQLAYGLRSLCVQGITTNRELLIRLLEHPQFRTGEIDTHFIDRHPELLEGPPNDRVDPADAAIAATLAAHEARRRARTVAPTVEPGYRNNRFALEQIQLVAGDRTLDVGYRNQGKGRFHVTVDGNARQISSVSYDGHRLEYEQEDGRRRRYGVCAIGPTHYVHTLDGEITLVQKPRFPDAAAQSTEGGCVAPMPGAVVRVLASEGERVDAGTTLVVIEAMKMEHAIKAPDCSSVAAVLVSEGDHVDAGQLLVALNPTTGTA